MACIPKDEIKRKSFHLLSLLYIFGYWYLSKNIVIFGLIVVMIIVVLLEYIRFKLSKVNDFFKNNFKGFYRFEEVRKVSGLIWTLSGAFIAIVLFPNKSIVFVSLLCFAFGDTVAALVGRGIGRHKIFTNKSLEGSFACFIVCFIIGLFFFNIQFALIGAISATLTEAIFWKLSDNFWMQIINTGILTAASSVIAWAK
ncbi:MAG: hypothetical protein LBL02_00155 [Endomicrobium sp.]|jgi:dolichol kinase|nr:hypothetical protein [Endomicrobium sp.]